MATSRSPTRSSAQGPTDIVFVRGITGDLLSTWEQPLLVRHVEGLAACGRVLMLDKRGTGLSDRVREVQSLETTMDDVRAVMDAAGSERAVLWTGGTSTGIGVLFAATYPERCAGLVLFDPRMRGTRSADYPWAPTEEEWREQLAAVRAGWGERGYLERPRARVGARGGRGRRLPRLVRLAHASEPQPGRGADVVPHRDGARRARRPRRGPRPDARHPAPGAPRPGPLHRRADPGRRGRRAAAARGVYTWVDDEAHRATMEATERFVSRLTGTARSERVLATILFTDIVGSTELAARLGDSAWRELLERHHAIVRRELARFQGRELDTAGDGFFAAFDGPARAVRAAAAIRDALRELEIEIRAGLHTGECEVADGKLAGIAVSIGARIAALAAPGEVLVSSTVKDLVAGSGPPLRGSRRARAQGRPGAVAPLRADRLARVSERRREADMESDAGLRQRAGMPPDGDAAA